MSKRTMARNYSNFKQLRSGKCIICGDKVFEEQDFIAAMEGYCHRECVF